MVANGRQTEIISIVDNQIDNGLRCVIWQGNPLITSPKGNLLKNNADGVIFVVGIASGCARATLKTSEWRAKGGKFTAKAISRLSDFGVRVDDDRIGLLATDRLRHIAKKHAKDIEILKALPVTKDYERQTNKDRNSKFVSIICSDDCTLGKVLRQRGDSEQIEIIKSFACPSCKVKYHVKGTTPKVLTESTEIIKESVK